MSVGLYALKDASACPELHDWKWQLRNRITPRRSLKRSSA
jgi:hypothetical protein